jgi:hypothetical protein
MMRMRSGAASSVAADRSSMSSALSAGSPSQREVCHQRFAKTTFRDRREAGQAKIDVDGGVKERGLVAVVPHDHRGVDVCAAIARMVAL